MEQKRRGRPPKVNPTNWEALCKNLQKALEKEMDENERTSKDLNAQIRAAQQQAHDNSVELIKAKGIIEYLEANLEELHERFEDSGYKNLPPIFRNGE